MFTPFNIGSLSETASGTVHTIKFEISDGYGATTTASVNFKVDKTPPSLNQINVTSTYNTITISGVADDSISGLAANSYSYEIMAKNNGKPGTSGWSTPPLSINTLPNPPVAPSDITATPSINSMVLAWEGVSGATGYEISIDNGEPINCGTSLSYNNTGLNPNTLHTYRIRALNISGSSAWSVPIAKYTLANPPNSGTISAVTNNSVSASWNMNGNPEGVSYAMAAFDGDTLVKQNGWTTSLSDITSGLSPFNSLSGDEEVPKNISATSNSTAIQLTWDGVEGVIGYDVEINGNAPIRITEAAYTFNSLNPGTQYIFRIRSVNETGNSNWSGILTKSTMLDVPLNISSQAKLNEIILRWDTITNADGYEVEVDGNIIDNGNNTTYVDRNLISGTLHNYRVRAKNAVSTSEWSSVTALNCQNPEYSINCTMDEVISLVLSASQINNIDKLRIMVTYNKNELELIDACGLTPEIELSAGLIDDTGIRIAQIESGRLVLVVNRSEASGKTWSGIINSIIFRSKIDGQSTITYSIQ